MHDHQKCKGWLHLFLPLSPAQLKTRQEMIKAN